MVMAKFQKLDAKIWNLGNQEMARERPWNRCSAHFLSRSCCHDSRKPLGQVISQWTLCRLWWNLLPCPFKLETWPWASPIVGFIKGSSQVSVRQPWMVSEDIWGLGVGGWGAPNRKNEPWGFGPADIIETQVHSPKPKWRQLGPGYIAPSAPGLAPCFWNHLRDSEYKYLLLEQRYQSGDSNVVIIIMTALIIASTYTALTMCEALFAALYMY